MDFKQITLKEGASLNRPPCLRENIFCFGKRMEIFIQSIDPGAWIAIVKEPFIPTKEVNGELVPEEWDELKDDEKKRV